MDAVDDKVLTKFVRTDLESLRDSVPFWWHSIDLGDGVVTPGAKSAEWLNVERESLSLGDLSGKTVLDIGAWDGYYSYEAERRGAVRVVALDHYVWSLDLLAQQGYWRECQELGLVPRPYNELPELWHPETLPGKAGFDAARLALGSGVEAIVADFMSIDTSAIGTFDVVLYLGVLYHMENPIDALRRVRSVADQVAIIQTQAIAIPDCEDTALCEFFATNELNADVSNWWAPNEKALHGMCRAAGFCSVETVGRLSLGDWTELSSRDVHRLALAVHARP